MNGGSKIKKYLTIMTGVCLLLTATGCGKEVKEENSAKDDTKDEEKAKSKVLSCSQDGEDLTFLYDLKDKKLAKVTIVYTDNLADLEDGEFEGVSSICEELNDDHIKSCEVKKDSEKVFLTINYDIDKLDGDAKIFSILDYDGDKFYGDKEEVTKDTPINELKDLLVGKSNESDGLTCKIEEK